MRRRFLILMCVISILLTMCIFPVNAATSGECGDNATWSLSSSGVLRISGTGAMQDYIYSGYSMWPNIIAPWRENKIAVTSIVIDEGITSIGKNAFCCLPKLTSVTIPSTVSEIGDAAFCNDKLLNNVVIPDSVRIIRKSAFKECKELTQIKLPSNLEILEGSCFESCSKLAEITLPSTITEIGGWNFAYCGKLTHVVIPEGVTIINNSAFAYSGLQTIQLPNSLQEINPLAFHTSKLTQITIPANVTYVGQDAFATCMELRAVQFTGNAPAFDSHVFNGITVTATYSKGNTTWTEAVCQNYGGTVKWVAACTDSHNWGSWKIEKEATCDKPGTKVQQCTKCELTNEESTPQLTHQYEPQVKAPTCTKKGYTTHICKLCGDRKIDTYTDPAHSYGEWENLKTATCLEKGTRQRKCTLCTEQQSEETALGDHIYSNQVTAPSCTQEGYTTHICTVCAHAFTDTPTERTAHNYGEWTVIKPASKEQEGERHRKCIDCSIEQKEAIPKLTGQWGVTIGISAAVVLLIAAATVFLVRHRKKQNKNEPEI